MRLFFYVIIFLIDFGFLLCGNLFNRFSVVTRGVSVFFSQRSSSTAETIPDYWLLPGPLDTWNPEICLRLRALDRGYIKGEEWSSREARPTIQWHSATPHPTTQTNSTRAQTQRQTNAKTRTRKAHHRPYSPGISDEEEPKREERKRNTKDKQKNGKQKTNEKKKKTKTPNKTRYLRTRTRTCVRYFKI